MGAKSKTVLFLLQSVDIEKFPSSRVRVANLLPYLEQQGIRAEYALFPNRKKDKFTCFSRLGKYDAVCLQRRLPCWLDLFLLKKFAKRLLFDFDDAVYQRKETEANPYSRTRQRRFSRMVRAADCVLAGNKLLAHAAEEAGGKVVVVPSSVPTTGIPLRQRRDPGLPIRIGWIGTEGNLGYLAMLEPQIRALSQKYAVELHVISSRSIAMPGVKIAHKQWKLEKQQEDLACLDIGVMPLPSNSWTEGKCGYKTLQYMSAGVVPICSGVGENAVAIEDGVTGFVVQELADFARPLEKLIQEPELCNQMGEAAREAVIEKYSVEAVANQVARLLS